MAERFSSEVLAVITAVAWDEEPTVSTLRLALYGGMYIDPDNPSGTRLHYDGRIKSDIVFDKKIGLAFWKEESGIDFGYLDISVENQADDYIDFAKNVTVATVELYRVDHGVEIADQLELLAVAQCSDIGFADENTIRLRLESVLENGFDAPINELYYDETNPQLAGKPYPIAWALIEDPMQLFPTVLVDGTTLLYHVTDVVIDSFEGNVYDRGIPLIQTTEFVPTTHGFTLNQNPDGKITCGRILLLDPEETGSFLVGLHSFVRLAMTRAGIWQYANEYELIQLAEDIGMGDLYPMFYTNRVTSLEDFLDEIFRGVTGWFYVDELTEVHFGRLTNPDNESSPAFNFTDSNVIGRIKVEDDKAPGLSTRAAYGFSPGAYTEDEVAGAVDGEDRINMTNGHWVVETTEVLVPVIWTADDDSWTADDIEHTADGYAGTETREVSTYFWKAGTAEPINIALGFCDDSDCSSFALAQAEVDRWWNQLYPTRRRFYTFDTKINDSLFNTVLPQLGEFCTLQSDRFKLLTVPKSLFIRRLKFNFSKNLLTVVGWG